MNLFIDVGNTSIHWRLSGGLEKNSPTVSMRHKKDWKKALTTLRSTLGEERVGRIAVACVAGQEAKLALETWGKEEYSIKPVFVRSQKNCVNVSNAYDEPETLGVDRWLAILAGHHLMQKENFSAALVVDAGTAMTIDAVLKDGAHLGGNIIAGYELLQSSLLSNISEIYASNGDETVWGKSTASAVANGAQLALLGALVLAYEQLHQSIGIESRLLLLLTGGDAEILEAFFTGRPDIIYSVHNNLVLDGLEIYLASLKSE